jgi:hypothetical protein
MIRFLPLTQMILIARLTTSAAAQYVPRIPGPGGYQPDTSSVSQGRGNRPEQESEYELRDLPRTDEVEGPATPAV